MELGRGFVELAHTIVSERAAGYRFEHDGQKNGDLAVGNSVVVGYMECGGKFGDGVAAGCSNREGSWIQPKLPTQLSQRPPSSSSRAHPQYRFEYPEWSP